jgi:hypothetical protein
VWGMGVWEISPSRRATVYTHLWIEAKTLEIPLNKGDFEF